MGEIKSEIFILSSATDSMCRTTPSKGQPAPVVLDCVKPMGNGWSQMVKDGTVPTTTQHTGLVQVHSHTLTHTHTLSLMQFVQRDLRRPGKPDVDGHKSA